MKNDASMALSCPQNRTARRVRSYERLWFGNSIMWPEPIRCGKVTSLPCQLDAIYLLDGRSATALASDGAKPGAGRALRRRKLLDGYVEGELQSRSPCHSK